jgi:hypothetical protein
MKGFWTCGMCGFKLNPVVTLWCIRCKHFRGRG